MIVDLHSHILPNVDDGAVSLEDALEMAQCALESGVSHMVATPHFYDGGHTTLSQIQQAYAELTDALEYEQLPLQLSLGMEIMACDELPALLAEKKVLTYPNSSYFLVEFFPDEDPDYMHALLEQCMQGGFTPVVAHPERYWAVQHDPEHALRWLKKGYGVQINRDSLLGMFGNHAANCAEYLMNHGWCNCIASDAHSPRTRNTQWDWPLEQLQKLYRSHTLKNCLVTVPNRILAGQPLIEE